LNTLDSFESLLSMSFLPMTVTSPNLKFKQSMLSSLFASSSGTNEKLGVVRIIFAILDSDTGGVNQSADTCPKKMALRLANAFGGLESELRRHERRQKPNSENMAVELMDSPSSFLLPGIKVRGWQKVLHFENLL
jgi:hypothetical protein